MCTLDLDHLKRNFYKNIYDSDVVSEQKPGKGVKIIKPKMSWRSKCMLVYGRVQYRSVHLALLPSRWQLGVIPRIRKNNLTYLVLQSSPPPETVMKSAISSR